MSFIEPPNPIGLTTITDWFLEEKRKAIKHPEGWQNIVSNTAITLWFIWNERNRITFDGGPPSPFGVVVKCKNLLAEMRSLFNSRQAAPVPAAPTAPCKSIVKWRPPQPGSVKINTDASFNLIRGKGSGGIIIRDHQGISHAGLAINLFASSSLMAEAIVLREAVSLASNLDLRKVVFESDCLELVQACRSTISRGEIKGIIEDIQTMSSLFATCGFLWTARDGNKVAHNIAALQSLNQLPPNWPVNLPLVLQDLIHREA